MSYIEENLMPNEKVLLWATIHPAAFIIPFSFLIIISCGLLYFLSTFQGTPWLTLLIEGIVLVQVVPPLVRAVIAFGTTEFAVTNQRVMVKTGLIRQRTREILLQKIESVKIDQGLLGRFFGYGSIEVIGTGGSSSKFIAVRDPLTLRKNINKVIEYQLKRSRIEANPMPTPSNGGKSL